jgi:hypothetical protein
MRINLLLNEGYGLIERFSEDIDITVFREDIADCIRHARMLFNRPDLDLTSAVPGSFALTPHVGMLAELRRDYEAMSDMVFVPIPTVDAVVAAITELEQRLNRRR